MEQINCTLKPESDGFAVPYSTGYQTYSGLLSLIDKVNSELANDLHDTPFASLANSGLLGSFEWGIKKQYRKRLYSDAEYELQIGVTHPDDEAVFNALTKALVISNAPLELAHGALRVTGIETRSRTHKDLLSEAAETAKAGAYGVKIQFETPTCCSRYDDVWEAHPDRVHLFTSLADRWNATAAPEQELAVNEETLGSELYTVADTGQYDTHSIVVHRREPTQANADDAPTDGTAADGGEHLNEAQGFTGTWEFRFKNASEATKTAVIALAKFAEFRGIGRHTARGAGTVSTTLLGGNDD